MRGGADVRGRLAALAVGFGVWVGVGVGVSWSGLATSGPAIPEPAQARTLQTAEGDVLDVRVHAPASVAGRADGPLFIWLANQYAEMARPQQIAAWLAAEGATVWQVDLLDALFLERSAEAIRSMSGTPVATLVEAAVAEAAGAPVLLVASDRMAAPALKGLHVWQQRRAAEPDAAHEGPPAVGAVLFFPNLYRGTPVAGEPPELLSVVQGTTLPVMIMQPELGTNRARLGELLAQLHRAGSPAHAWLVRGMRDYYLLQTEQPASESLENLAGPVPPEVEEAIAATPARLLASARLLAAAPRPQEVVNVGIDDDAPVVPAYGLIERPADPAPGFVLHDARGVEHAMDEQAGRVTLVNFWATWCPPCVHEIPSMNRLAAAYDGEDFAIVSVNFKEEAAHILAFMNRVRVDFPVLMDEDGAVSGRWGVFAFPSSFLVDREGRVRYSVNTAIEWDADEVKSVIDALVAE